MFFRRPLFYLAPDAEGGASVAEAESAVAADDEGGEEGITDAEVSAIDSGGSATAEAETEEGSLADRIQKSDLSEVWKQHGFDDLPADPAQLRAQYHAGLQAQREAQQYKDQLLWQLHQANQQRPAPQPQQPIASPKVFNLPEFDPQWLGMVYTNEQGELVAKPGAQPDLPMKIQAFAKAREEANIKLLQDPIGVLQQHLAPMIQQQAQQVAAQQLQQYARQREIQQFEQQNASWIFNNRVDASQGLTPAANYFNDHYRQAQAWNLPDPVGYAQDKLDAVGFRMGLQEQTQSDQQASAAQQAKAADKSFINRTAARQASRGGSMPSKTTPKPPQNPKDLFGTLRKRLEALPPGALDEK